MNSINYCLTMEPVYVEHNELHNNIMNRAK